MTIILQLGDARWYEKFSVGLLIVGITAIGMFPLWLSDMIMNSLGPIVDRLTVMVIPLDAHLGLELWNYWNNRTMILVMTFENLLLMRHEIVLTIITMIILIAELAMDDKVKQRVVPLAIGLFLVHTIIGFLPLREGILFGGMFHTNGTITLMKNVLNIGVLIVFMQSWTWIRHPENHPKVSEYFLLIISTLIGMNFMISSGDFLMFYIGLELATIPLAALAAYERHKNRSAEAGVKLILSSALSSAILLYGISMIYGTTGSIYFTNISTVILGKSTADPGLYLLLQRHGI